MTFTATVESTLEADWTGAMRTFVVGGIRQGVRDAVREGVAEAKTTHRYKDRTGDLTRSIMPGTVLDTEFGAESEMRADAPYAAYVEEGTRPHPIYPKAAAGFVGPLYEGQSRRKRGTGAPRALLAWEEPQGDWHFARKVNHPGTDPLPFMGTAALKFERVAEREIEVGIARAAAHLEGR